MWLRWLLVIWLGFIMLLFSPRQVGAAQVTVGSGTPESCTEAALDSALAAAQNGDTISFNCGGAAHTITVTSPKFITRSITIDGGDLITLSGGGTTTILELNDGLPLLTVQNITIANGYATPAGPYGVCRDNACGGGMRGHYRASLTVINSRFVNNQAAATPITGQANLDFGGGAIYLHTGILTVSNSTFVNNRAINSAGGAIHILHSNASVSDSLFDGNQADFYGGAFFNDGTINDGQGITTNGVVQFRRNTFINNTGRGQGGANFNFLYQNRQLNVLADYDTNRFINNHVTADIANHAYGGAIRTGGGPVRIGNSTFSGNTAESQGGALWTSGLGTLYVWNSTFYDNAAAGLNENDGYGGALRIGSAKVNLNNITVADNHAGQLGGGIWGEISNVALVNTIIVNNSATNPWDMSQNCDRTYGGSNNLQSPRIGPGDKPCSTSVRYGDPLLGPLADHGAFGQMMALLSGSPAIDAGINGGCTEFDQRGSFRTFDGNWDGIGQCDLGAYEYATFDLAASASAPPYRNRFDTATPRLNWLGLAWATAYQIQVDNNADFKSVNFTYEADQTEADIGPLPGGVFYWRVRGQHADGSWGNWSAGDNFLVLVS